MSLHIYNLIQPLILPNTTKGLLGFAYLSLSIYISYISLFGRTYGKSLWYCQ